MKKVGLIVDYGIRSSENRGCFAFIDIKSEDGIHVWTGNLEDVEKISLAGRPYNAFKITCSQIERLTPKTIWEALEDGGLPKDREIYFEIETVGKYTNVKKLSWNAGESPRTNGVKISVETAKNMLASSSSDPKPKIDYSDIPF